MECLLVWCKYRVLDEECATVKMVSFFALGQLGKKRLIEVLSLLQERYYILKETQLHCNISGSERLMSTIT